MWGLLGRRPRIAVLGAQVTGKTTLIRHWRGEHFVGRLAPTDGTDRSTKATIDGLAVSGLTDVSGSDSAWPAWRQLVQQSRFVLYLVDARALCGCLDWLPRRDVQRVHDDVVQIGQWLSPDCSILIAVTHTDEDCRRQVWNDEEGTVTDEAYQIFIRRQLDSIISACDLPKGAAVVLGDLGSAGAADQLSHRIAAHFGTHP